MKLGSPHQDMRLDESFPSVISDLLYICSPLGSLEIVFCMSDARMRHPIQLYLVFVTRLGWHMRGNMCGIPGYYCHNYPNKLCACANACVMLLVTCLGFNTCAPSCGILDSPSVCTTAYVARWTWPWTYQGCQPRCPPVKSVVIVACRAGGRALEQERRS